MRSSSANQVALVYASPPSTVCFGVVDLMNATQRFLARIMVKLRIHESKGAAFQKLFEQIMTYGLANASAQELAAEASSRRMLRTIVAVLGTLVGTAVSVLPGCIAPAYLQSSAERRKCVCTSIATIEYEGAQVFPYLASEAKRSRVLNGYSQLKPGTPVDECMAFLGTPDKCFGRGPKLGRCEGIALCYDLYHKRRDLVTEGSDVYVVFKFDLDWRFVGTYPEEQKVRAALDERLLMPADATSPAASAPVEQR